MVASGKCFLTGTSGRSGLLTSSSGDSQGLQEAQVPCELLGVLLMIGTDYALSMWIMTFTILLSTTSTFLQVNLIHCIPMTYLKVTFFSGYLI